MSGTPPLIVFRNRENPSGWREIVTAEQFENGQVLSFHEPEEGVVGPINGGVYAIHRAVAEAIALGEVSLEDAIWSKCTWPAQGDAPHGAAESGIFGPLPAGLSP
jgi:hypothetical protein